VLTLKIYYSCKLSVHLLNQKPPNLRFHIHIRTLIPSVSNRYLPSIPSYDKSTKRQYHAARCYRAQRCCHREFANSQGAFIIRAGCRHNRGVTRLLVETRCNRRRYDDRKQVVPATHRRLPRRVPQRELHVRSPACVLATRRNEPFGSCHRRTAT